MFSDSESDTQRSVVLGDDVPSGNERVASSSQRPPASKRSKVENNCGSRWRDYVEVVCNFREAMNELSRLQQQPNERVVRRYREAAYSRSLLVEYNDVPRIPMDLPQPARGEDPVGHYRYWDFRYRVQRMVRMIELLRMYIYVVSSNADIFMLNVTEDGCSIAHLSKGDAAKNLEFVRFEGYAINDLLNMAPAFDTPLPKMVHLNFSSLVIANSFFPRFHNVGWVPCPSYMIDHYPVDSLNLYTGIALNRQVCSIAQDYDPSLLYFLLNYLRFMFCDNDAQFKRLIELNACIVVAPYLRTEVLLAIVGKQGHGKSMFVRILERILGTCCLVTFRQDSLTGQFADLLKTLVVCDDAAPNQRFTADYDATAKALVTATTVTQNKKFVNPVNSKNYMNLWVLDNYARNVPDLVENGRRVFFLSQSSDQIIEELGVDKTRFFQSFNNAIESGALPYLFARFLYSIYTPEMNDRVRVPLHTNHELYEIAQRQFQRDEVVQFVIQGIEAGGFVMEMQPVETTFVNHLGLPQTSVSYKQAYAWQTRMPIKTLHGSYGSRSRVRISETEFAARFVNVFGPNAMRQGAEVQLAELAECKAFLANHFLADTIKSDLAGRAALLRQRMGRATDFINKDLTGDLWGYQPDDDVDDYELYNMRPTSLKKRAQSSSDIAAALWGNQ